MKRTIYEVWAKTYSEELQDTIMVIKARFYKITEESKMFTNCSQIVHTVFTNVKYTIIRKRKERKTK